MGREAERLGGRSGGWDWRRWGWARGSAALGGGVAGLGKNAPFFCICARGLLSFLIFVVYLFQERGGIDTLGRAWGAGAAGGPTPFGSGLGAVVVMERALVCGFGHVHVRAQAFQEGVVGLSRDGFPASPDGLVHG